MMNRRNFLKLGAMTLAGAALPKYSSAEQLKYPLTSVPDKGTNLDESKAAKARKLVEYVITRDKQPGLLSYNPNSTGGSRDYQGVQAVMVIDGQRYTVWVANSNENAKPVMSDLMSFWVRPEGTKGQDELTTFSDTGLDGRCDFGIIPAKMSGIGKQVLFRDGTDGTKPEGLEHKDRFQSLYNGTLDTLIKFYERSK